MGLNLQLLLKDKTAIALDTALFIYLIEENPTYIRIVEQIFIEISRGNIYACTSTITLIEVLTKPLEENNTELIQKYSEIMSDSAYLLLCEVDRAIAVESARLRATYSLRTPDAIQLATGIVNGAELFITNDRGFKKVQDIEILILDDLM